MKKRKHFKPMKRKRSFTKRLINIWDLLPRDTAEIRNQVRAQWDSTQTPVWVPVGFTGTTGELWRYEMLDEELRRMGGCEGAWAWEGVFLCSALLHTRPVRWYFGNFLVQTCCRGGMRERWIVSFLLSVFCMMAFEKFSKRAAGT